jgi:hypothetical protein
MRFLPLNLTTYQWEGPHVAVRLATRFWRPTSGELGGNTPSLPKKVHGR